MKKTHGEVTLVDGKRVATPEYRSWQMMKNRCLNPRARDYAYYGGRGISVCTAWLSFEGFLKDMGRRPLPTSTLERLDTAASYCAANCVWASREAQARNRKYATTRIWELADKLGVSRTTTWHYLWVVRSEQKGKPVQYTVPAETRAIINKHLEELADDKTTV